MPEGLSAKPTLSVRTESPVATRATITLSYLAWGFDWQTNYVVSLDPATGKADMLAWVTLASSDPTSFADAATAVVGGKVNREDAQERPGAQDSELVLQCYLGGRPVPPPVVMMPEMVAMPMMAPMMSADIIVTAQRRSAPMMEAAVKVIEEGLGDLKLYRVPMPTTVASNAQKQVALHDLKGVTFKVFHTDTLTIGQAHDAEIKLRTRNRKDEGLGVALPGGPVAVFEPNRNGELLLAGKGGMGNYAVGEDVELALGASPAVQVRVKPLEATPARFDLEATVTNANPWPVTFEGTVYIGDGEKLERPSSRLTRKFGKPIWTTIVPANGTTVLRYRVIRPN
jgi:hypothetical protein